MRRLVLALPGLTLIGLAACGVPTTPTVPSATSTVSATPPESATPATATPDTASPASASPATGTPSGTQDAAACLTGNYRLTRFEGSAAGTTIGSGEGGDVTVAFSPGSYRMTGAGKQPSTVVVAGQRGSLLVNGTLAGDYQTNGDQASFTIREATGGGTVSVLGQSRTLTMQELGSVIGLTGTGSVTCSTDQLIVTMANVKLEFAKA
jgi:hypothetical protein